MILCKLDQQQSLLRKVNNKILYTKAFVANRTYANWKQLLINLLTADKKARCVAELALMEDLLPYLQKQAGEREISGLKAYE